MEEHRELLQDLVEINNDRAEGYTKAIELLHDGHDDDLRQIFVQYRSQTQQFVSQLTPFLADEGELPTDATRVSGKLFRLWMDLKGAITGHDRRSILESCERGEDAFKKTYEEAIKQLDTVPLPLANIIRQQAEQQYMAHNHIKTLRDAS
ncbi:ferritin-like domain-containing protein [Sphingobacterium suaedae]|uniref:PA2169 family four-helix-bundle protein n=1 Tax=Sphingobacterium suaedae TaxID=1686402 RepID=A0ABW5KL95_9SPHI